MIRIEHNIETGEILEIELTKKEIAEKEASDKINLDSLATKESEKESLLTKLGITADEAALLLS
jgi:bifunctional DNA-binding transcriptional regulator/antitoxin component of YhaV-PrlF toxin-antitoxin module